MQTLLAGEQGSQPILLIVEDHDAMRTALREWLSETFPACDLVEARSGEEGVALAEIKSPDIVVMDIGLPDMSGIEATRQIKKAVPQVQVVMLTIFEDPAYQADAREAGASGYVFKHRMHTDLIPIVASLLACHGGAGGTEGDPGPPPVRP